MDQWLILLPQFKWPLAVIVIVLGVVLILRDSFKRLIDRTKSFAYVKSFQAHTENQPTANESDAFTKFRESLQNPLLLEVERGVEKEIRDQELTDPSDIRKFLTTRLAGALIQAHFELIQSSIFASQFEALTRLNELQGATMDKLHLKQRFYDNAAAKLPKEYEIPTTFELWFEYLRRQVLIAVEGERVGISSRGREFLKWRVEQGRPRPWYF